MKETAKAHSNIALVKYWGKQDEGLRLPRNSSVSIALDEAYTLTTVEFDEAYTRDEVSLVGQGFDDIEVGKVIAHLDRVRSMAGMTLKAKVVSQNNFPKSAGMASSASGFAALSMAATAAAGLNLSERELSVLARNGSGSASRSIPGGVAVWHVGETDGDSYAEQIAMPADWNIRVLMVMAEDTSAKKISTTDGMMLAKTSPYFEIGVAEAEKNLKELQRAMNAGDWRAFGAVIEDECFRLHAMCMTSRPNILYWRGVTVEVFQALYRLRERSILAFFTVDAGPHVHVVVREQDARQVKAEMVGIPGVGKVIECGIGPEATLVEQHLF